jgi:hypothetical protein
MGEAASESRVLAMSGQSMAAPMSIDSLLKVSMK